MVNTKESSPYSAVQSLASNGSAYAIVIDLSKDALAVDGVATCEFALAEIGRILKRRGFTWSRGNVFFGGEAVNAVTGVLAALDLSEHLPWFVNAVCGARLMRIEAFDDLLPAILSRKPMDSSDEGGCRRRAIRKETHQKSCE